MSFALRYRPFLSVRVLERDGEVTLPGFRFAPTPFCETMLADHRLVFRPAEGGFRLLWKGNLEAVDPVAARIGTRVRLAFVMWPPGRDLLRTFEPDLTQASGPRFHFHNLTASGKIRSRDDLTDASFVQARDAVRFVPSTFHVTLGPEETRTATTCRVSPRIPAGAPLLELPISAALGARQATVRIDLTGRLSGAYVLETDAPAAVPRAVYVSDEVVRTTALAAVELHWDRGQDTVPSGGVQYQIRFRRR